VCPIHLATHCLQLRTEKEPV